MEAKSPRVSKSLFEIKYTEGGRELVDLLRAYQKDLVDALIDVDPDEVGQVGIIQGKLRVYRGLEALLMAEYMEEESK